MDKNTVIGLTLIGALLVVFTYMNQPSDAEIKAQKEKEKKELAETKKKDSSTKKVESTKTVSTQDETKKASAPKVLFKPENIRLESDKLIVDISTKGGNVSAVQLKEYESYLNFAIKDNKITPLYLFKEGDQKNQLIFNYKGNKYTTGNAPFEIVEKSANKVVLKHDVADGSIEYTYAIKDDYNVDFDIKFNNLNDQVTASSMVLDWKMEMLRSERLLSEQRRVSTICYQIDDKSVDYNKEFGDSYRTAESDIHWVAYKQSYFSSILRPTNGKFLKEGTKFTSLEYDKGSSYYFSHIKKYQSKLNLGLNSVKDGRVSFSWFFGPNDYHLLASYNQNYDDILNLGWGIFRWCNLYFVQPLFEFFMNFGINAGIAILFLTLVIKLFLTPIQWKMFVSSAKMRILKPQIDEINAKYPNKEDAMKKQMDMMALYRASGASPLAGCVPMLIQMPILLAVFRFFPTSFSLRQEGFLWANDLSSYDSIVDFSFYIPFYGNHISLFTLLMAATTLIYTHLNSSNMTQPQQPGMPNMKVIMYIFPVLMIFFFNNYSAGLSYYYFISTLITILLMALIKNYFVDEEKLKAKMAEAQSKNSSKKAKDPKKKSSFMQRLEEMQQKQQEQLKNKKK
jgi:YidC/Oxa1 family membrane protein insertase